MEIADFTPTRYSIDQADYNPELGRNLKITLNGVVQDSVLEYDCEAGTITRYVTDENGRLVVDCRLGEAKRETVNGLVTVSWKD